MNKQKSSKKTVIITVVVLALLVIGYFYYNGTPSSSGSLLQTAPDASQAIGSQVLGLLNQIQSLKIDTTLFMDPAYLTLHDFTIAIPVLNVGRPNPFAPLPGESTNKTPATQH
jgi:hypothetical protein